MPKLAVLVPYYPDFTDNSNIPLTIFEFGSEM
jgi:hypothetical protein